MRGLNTFRAQLERSFRRLHLQQTTVLLAVSGGADSLSLLQGAASLSDLLELKLGVATVDHGARPGSRLDVQKVREHAASLGLPFFTRALRLREGAGFEARAREARYAALEAMRVEAGARWIATAHTASDQAETVLMRLLRGTSARGLRAIHPVAGRVVRPMLELTREEVEAYLAAQGLSPVRDPMNEDRRFLRVAVRQELLPLLERLAPGAVRRLAEVAERAGEDEAYLQTAAAEAEERLRVAGGWDAVGLAALAPPLRSRVVGALIEAHGAPLDRRRVRLLEEAIATGASAELTRGLMLHAQGGLVRVVRSTERRRRERPLSLTLGGSAREPRSGLTFTLLNERPSERPAQLLALPPSVPLPLSIRARLPGDRVGRGKKLQDVLVDAAVPREQRDALCVVTDASGRIVWVPGVWPKRPSRERGAMYLAVDGARRKRATE